MWVKKGRAVFDTEEVSAIELGPRSGPHKELSRVYLKGGFSAPLLVPTSPEEYRALVELVTGRPPENLRDLGAGS